MDNLERYRRTFIDYITLLPLKIKLLNSFISMTLRTLKRKFGCFVFF